MTRIRLAHWYDGHAPGDEIDIEPDQVAALRSDGRVAEVLPDAEAASMSEPTPPTEVVALDEPEPRAAAEPAKRTRKT